MIAHNVNDTYSESYIDKIMHCFINHYSNSDSGMDFPSLLKLTHDAKIRGSTYMELKSYFDFAVIIQEKQLKVKNEIPREEVQGIPNNSPSPNLTAAVSSPTKRNLMQLLVQERKTVGMSPVRHKTSQSRSPYRNSTPSRSPSTMLRPSTAAVPRLHIQGLKIVFSFLSYNKKSIGGGENEELHIQRKLLRDHLIPLFEIIKRIHVLDSHSPCLVLDERKESQGKLSLKDTAPRSRTIKASTFLSLIQSISPKTTAGKPLEKEESIKTLESFLHSIEAVELSSSVPEGKVSPDVSIPKLNSCPFERECYEMLFANLDPLPLRVFFDGYATTYCKTEILPLEESRRDSNEDMKNEGSMNTPEYSYLKQEWSSKWISRNVRVCPYMSEESLKEFCIDMGILPAYVSEENVHKAFISCAKNRFSVTWGEEQEEEEAELKSHAWNGDLREGRDSNSRWMERAFKNASFIEKRLSELKGETRNLLERNTQVPVLSNLEFADTVTLISLFALYEEESKKGINRPGVLKSLSSDQLIYLLEVLLRWGIQDERFAREKCKAREKRMREEKLKQEETARALAIDEGDAGVVKGQEELLGRPTIATTGYPLSPYEGSPAFGPQHIDSQYMSLSLSPSAPLSASNASAQIIRTMSIEEKQNEVYTGELRSHSSSSSVLSSARSTIRLGTASAKVIEEPAVEPQEAHLLNLPSPQSSSRGSAFILQKYALPSRSDNVSLQSVPSYSQRLYSTSLSDSQPFFPLWKPKYLSSEYTQSVNK